MTPRCCVLHWRTFCGVFRSVFTGRKGKYFTDVSCVMKNRDPYFSELQPIWKHELSHVPLNKLISLDHFKENIIGTCVKDGKLHTIRKLQQKRGTYPHKNCRISFKISRIFSTAVSESPQVN